MLIGEVDDNKGIYALAGTAAEFEELYLILYRVKAESKTLSAMAEQVIDDTCAEIQNEILGGV